jgi:hypothetical protein
LTLLFSSTPRLVLTNGSIYAGIPQSKALNRLATDNVAVNDFVHVCRCDAAIPDRVRIDHDIRPVLALIEAARLIGSYSSLQSALGQLLLE